MIGKHGTEPAASVRRVGLVENLLKAQIDTIDRLRNTAVRCDEDAVVSLLLVHHVL